MYNVVRVIYVHAHESDRLMSACTHASLSPATRCELIEFYGRYHLPPTGGPTDDYIKPYTKLYIL